ncbi:MAG TPA: helix-turn-helix transcriptional regulator [Oscillatoriaceae cyanobacterium M33_DOE_052]|uniref:XRE family transcriptional regulator n=1 Tax=Planktothricoides sp. SpSt-374 TaxID=2282167 RepID=A0A7C3ZM46_9CYAN|nr:helix-turn-helix transcriptional regulator [Oscillatoriaceae cyanobacterium M33_DOE_052]
MIKDEKQYKLTQQLVGEFEKSLAAIEKDEHRIKADPDGWEIIRGSLKYHVDKLTAEIAEYERLISHDRHEPIPLTIENFNDLPQILIKARIAAKLSQKELADLAGITTEQIQRYEDNDYEDASFLEIKFVIDALDIKIHKGELIVPLDTLRRTPVTKEELLFSRSRTHSKLERQTSKQVQ